MKQIKYVIIDADAINSYSSKNLKTFKNLDKYKLITPHHAEFHRTFSKNKKKLN